MSSNPVQNEDHCATAASRTAIIAGFGPVGRVVADMMAAAGIAITVIETNADTVRTQQQLGRRAMLGDACDPAVLAAAGVATASALVLSMPDEADSVRACAAARKLAPHLYIAVRTNFVSQGLAAKAAGADAVVIEELVTAMAMKDAVMGHLRTCGVACK